MNQNVMGLSPQEFQDKLQFHFYSSFAATELLLSEPEPQFSETIHQNVPKRAFLNFSNFGPLLEQQKNVLKDEENVKCLRLSEITSQIMARKAKRHPISDYLARSGC